MTRVGFLSGVLGAVLSSSVLFAADSAVKIKEGWSGLTITSEAPIPSEVQNETQAQALSREAAITLGQTELLNYVLKKKTKSGKPLSEAEIPSVELQRRVRGWVKGAIIKKTEWKNGVCRVTMDVSKSDLKDMLKRN